MTRPRINKRIALSLALSVVFVFWGATANGFIDLDDDYYVTLNAHVNRGLTGEGIAWALTSVNYFYWQPLTWISHMADCEMYGLNPWGHHLTSILLHAANAVLAFWALFRLTGAMWPSALAAAIFAVHPLRVESVAWVAERKDLLSVFFWLWSLIAYESYARTKNMRSYWLTLAAAVAGLASKPTLVTLPFLLLLLDWWPLQRKDGIGKRITEKIPLFALSIVASVLTYLGQQEMGAVASNLSLATRLSNAIFSYARYLGKSFWPSSLAVVYPYDRNLSIVAVAASAVLVVAITAVCLWQARRRPFLIVGWLWFAGTLVPTLGIVQVGMQSMGDRFTYFPMLGLLLALIWLVPEARLKPLWAVPVLFAYLAYVQTAYWKDSFTLFTHALESEPANPKIQNQLANVLIALGKNKEAVPHLEEALRIDPEYQRTRLNLGAAYLNVGRYPEAVTNLEQFLKLNPNSGEARFTLGVALAQSGKSEESGREFELALRQNLRADHAAQAHDHLGVALARAGRPADAEKRFRAAIATYPEYASAHRNLALALVQQNRKEEALEQLSRSIVATRGNPGIQRMYEELQVQIQLDAQRDEASHHK